MCKRNAFLFLFVLTVCALHADKVTLQNGRTIRGKILEQTVNRLTIQTIPGTFSLNLSGIKHIEKESEEENLLLNVELSLAKNDLGTALAAYQEAISGELSFSRLTEHFLENRPSLLSALNKTPEYQRERIGKILVSLIPPDPGTYSSESSTTDTLEFCFSLSGFLKETGETDRAAVILASLPQRFYDAFPKAKRDAVNFFKAETVRLAAEGNFDSAVTSLESLQNLDVATSRNSRILVYLRWGSRLRDQKQWADAAEIYARKLFFFSPEIVSNRLIYLFDKMESEAKMGSDYLTLIELIKKYAGFLPEEHLNTKLSHLYTLAGTLLLNDSKTTEAQNCFHSAFIASGKKDLSLLALSEYSSRLQGLKPYDYLGHYQLGLFCRKKGLQQKALEHFSIASRNPSIESQAQSELRMIRIHQCLDTINKAMGLYDKGEFTRALDMLQPVLNDAVTSEVLKEASQLGTLCRKQLEVESNKRPIMAVIYYQQAERHFLLEEYDNALVMLDYIIETYSDAPVIQKARNLMIMAMRRRELAQLEHGDRDTTRQKVVPQNAPVDRSSLNEQINKLLESLNDEKAK